MKAVYPGTFDPITYGHIDLIQKGLCVFDELVIAVAASRHLDTLFSSEERVLMVKNVLSTVDGIQVETFDGLLVKFMESKGISVILRGLRAVSDFEYEFQMALMNRKLSSKVETVFIMTSGEYSYLSSSMVREIAELGGCVKKLVPPFVRDMLKAKFSPK